MLAALRWALGSHHAGTADVRSVLDFGCGQGRYLPVLAERFPRARLAGADVSPVALELARRRMPGAELVAIEDERLPLTDRSVDLAVAIEVIEHVPDAGRSAAELARVLRPGGKLVLTAPCANPLSAAWLFNRATGGFEPTADGFGRFATDEPAHLRRLRSRDARSILAGAGIAVRAVRWWGHVATAVADNLRGVRSLPLPARRRLALLDWRLARRIPNGAAMIVVGERLGERAREAR